MSKAESGFQTNSKQSVFYLSINSLLVMMKTNRVLVCMPLSL